MGLVPMKNMQEEEYTACPIGEICKKKIQNAAAMLLFSFFPAHRLTQPCPSLLCLFPIYSVFVISQPAELTPFFGQ
jgi:hypothetical protein